MKKLLIGLSFIAIASLAHGQGTIAFGNSALTRVQIRELNGTFRNATAADGLVFGAFYGPANSPCEALVQASGLATIGTTAGVMVNASSVFSLPGTEPGQIVSLQIRAWDAATGGQMQCGATDVRQVTLAPAAGPGAVIWQSPTGTNPNRFTPLLIGVPGPVDCCVPEPSTFAIAALGGVWLLLRRVRGSKKG